MAEASLRGGVPVTAGWFVVNARQGRWLHNRMRSVCRFGGEGEAHFDDLGVSRYHAGNGDFVHCPPRTAHTIVTADQAALILAVGARKEKGSVRYPVERVAIAHGAGVPDEATPATEVYASFGEPTPGPAPDILPERENPGRQPGLSSR